MPYKPGPADALRYADLVRDERDPQRAARREVDDWFADIHGWPLTELQVRQRDEFLRLVLANLDPVVTS